MRKLELLGSIFVVCAVACAACAGDDNDNKAPGGSGGSAAAGTPAGGASMSGSTATAGSPTSGSAAVGGSTGGGTGSSGHCTPGTVQPSINFIGGTIDQCASVSGLTGGSNHLLDFELPKPIAPGDSFAFSVDMGAPEGDFDVYGTTEECGAVGEKLSTVHVLGNGVVCHAVKPVTGTYSHLIWVWHTAGEMKNMAMCEAGTCPAR